MKVGRRRIKGFDKKRKARTWRARTKASSVQLIMEETTHTTAVTETEVLGADGQSTVLRVGHDSHTVMRRPIRFH